MTEKKYIRKSDKSKEVDAYIGCKLRSVRRGLDLSQSQLAELVDVSYQQVQKYETGGNRVSAAKLYKISETLKVPIDHFFEGLEAVCDKQFRSLNILLIENNHQDIYKISNALKESNFSMTLNTLENGDQTYKYMSDLQNDTVIDSPDLILLDIDLPKKGGFEILKKIRQDEFLCYTPVIILTDQANIADIKFSYKNHASGFIDKSVIDREFYSKVQILVEYWTRAVALPATTEDAA
jgi:chemotaxis family two-component system response regulator Rcp1